MIAGFLASCAIPMPCDPERLNCDNGTRATGGAVSKPATAPAAKGPSESNNPGKPASGGQVGTPGKPAGGKPGHTGPKGDGKGGHGGKGK